jgi:cholesterol oxidase
VLRASGVGGGSLVYSNITIQPPDFVLKDPRWPLSWTDEERNRYFQLARDCIGFGVLNARDKEAGAQTPTPAINAGLSRIATRSAGLNPKWLPGTSQIDPAAADKNALWIDRARVFQTQMSGLADEVGNVHSSINDLPIEGTINKTINYCERQGRCNIGCLPGARHTLNKQLMRALFSHKPEEQLPGLSLEALAEVELIHKREEGYEIAYITRDPSDPTKTTSHTIQARKVVVAAGCLGTNELMLKCKAANSIPGLSDNVGAGFSTNGDYLAFLEGIDERVGLTRGPVTTSFAHFDSKEGKEASFHTIEDQGVPPSMANTVGYALPLLHSVSDGSSRWMVLGVLARWLLSRGVNAMLAVLKTAQPSSRSIRRLRCIPRVLCVLQGWAERHR